MRELRRRIDLAANFFSTTVANKCMWMLGPVLITMAFAIILALNVSFFMILAPMLDFKSDSTVGEETYFSVRRLLHSFLVVFLDGNILFNYALCVCTRNKGEKCERVLRELATATGYNYPETEAEVENSRREYEEKIEHRRKPRNHGVHQPSSSIPNRSVSLSLNDATPSNGNILHSKKNTVRNRSTSTVSNRNLAQQHGWTLLGPHEWGFCFKSFKPKPPRAHYDNVTRTLVLNMDHYCPWMFNTVGYFNYRYFVNFMLYVFLSMVYGAFISYRPFRNLSLPIYMKNIKLSRKRGFKWVQHMFPYVPTPKEKTLVSFTFMMCTSVGVAVFFLLSLHIYLLFTAQTTIEMHSNSLQKRLARSRGRTWVNPYDLGFTRNWQQVYGISNPLRALMPSRREPEFLPVPIAGNKGWRHPKGYGYDSDEDITLLL